MNTATTFLLCLATWRNRLEVLRARARTRRRRLETCLHLRLPVADSVAERAAMERFLHHDDSGSAMPRSWPYLRAILIAHSFASRPELQKRPHPGP